MVSQKGRNYSVISELVDRGWDGITEGKGNYSVMSGQEERKWYYRRGRE